MANICIDCEKSCGLCAWTAKLKPVEGWTATPVDRITKGRHKKGLRITACPLYEPTQRKAPSELWSDKEIDVLRDLLRQKARYKDIAVILGRSYKAVQLKALQLQYKRRSEDEDN